MKHLIKWCLSRLSSIYSCPLYVNQGSQYEVHTRTTRPPLPHLCFYFLSQLFSQFSHFLCSRDFAPSLIWKGWYYSQIQKKALKSISSSKFTKGCLLMLHELLIKLLKKRKLTLQSKKRIRLQLWNAYSTKGHNPKRWRVGKTAVGKKLRWERGDWESWSLRLLDVLWLHA